MVRGLERFKAHFHGFESRFVVIGGTACDVWLNSPGMGFRRTRDIDLVLVAERLDRAFAARFREFVSSGGYQRRARHGEVGDMLPVAPLAHIVRSRHISPVPRGRPEAIHRDRGRVGEDPQRTVRRSSMK